MPLPTTPAAAPVAKTAGRLLAQAGFISALTLVLLFTISRGVLPDPEDWAGGVLRTVQEPGLQGGINDGEPAPRETGSSTDLLGNSSDDRAGNNKTHNRNGTSSALQREGNSSEVGTSVKDQGPQQRLPFPPPGNPSGGPWGSRAEQHAPGTPQSGEQQGDGQPGSNELFAAGKRYYRTINSWDWCMGELHWERSFLCEAAEALRLNRTLVVNTDGCIWSTHNNGTTVIKPLAAYFDMEHLQRVVPFVPLKDFNTSYSSMQSILGSVGHNNASGAAAGHSNASGAAGEHSSSVFERTFPLAASTRALENESEAVVVTRDLFKGKFSYFICEEKNISWRIPRHALKYAAELVRIRRSIAADMQWDFDAVHVRRGDKIFPKWRARWPHVERDTRADAILQKLPKFIRDGRHLYIATNEETKGFFDPLRKSKYRVHMLQDYSYLWNSTSAWYKAYERIVGPNPEFDRRMQVIVDYTLLQMAKKKVETFNDLTSDPRPGVRGAPGDPAFRPKE